MPEKKSKTRTVRALLDLTFRKSPDRNDPAWDEFYTIPAGTVFTPEPHHKVDLMVATGKIEVVGDGKE